MVLQCPTCGRQIEPENVNITTNLAKCEGCQEVHRASDLVEQIDHEEIKTPPTGARTIVSNDRGDVIFTIPAAGLKGVHAFSAIFATFWICFIAFWTWGAAHGSIVFAAFSIPFWIVGIGMWIGLINAITQRQEIRVGRKDLKISKKSLLGSRTTVIPYSDIKEITVERVIPRNPMTTARHMSRMKSQPDSEGRVGIPMPTVLHGAAKTTFADFLEEAEGEWICRAVSAWVKSPPRRGL